ncbi:MAG TPA: hypothetical protein VFE46_05160 [Pirellulales bacterium]|jgi:fibronectin-binding autotransporter adhesin|nr:hypothetical protein [Pirellulales bacterium]
MNSASSLYAFLAQGENTQPHNAFFAHFLTADLESGKTNRHTKKLPMVVSGIFFLIAFVATSLCSRTTKATTVNWVPTGAGSWNNPANWSSNPSLPGAGDEATFISTLVGTGNAVTLDATNQTVGGVNVAAGTGGKGIDIQAGSPAGTLILTSTDTSGATVALTATSGLLVVDAPIQLGNGSTGSFTATFNDSTNTTNSFIVNGGITASAGQTWGVNITGSGAANAIVIFGTNAKTYNGDTTISSGGFLRISLANVLPFGSGTGNVIDNGTLNINNVDLNINGLSGSGTITKAGSNSHTLTIGNNNATGVNYSGSISLTGGSSGLTKTGSGVQTLSGATQSVAGALSVNVGTLLENGALSAASSTTAANATIGGTGTATLTGAFTANGNVAPGASAPGVLTVSAATGATFGTTGSLLTEIGGATPGNYDQLNFTNAAGAVSLNSASTLSLSLANAFTPSPSDIYYILSRADAGSFSTLFSGTTEGGTVSLGDGYTGQITYLANWTGSQAGSSLTGGNDIAIYSVVPEPPAGLLLAAAFSLGAVFIRNPRKV